jgi:anaerobic dimethyl sulfoxide reductase subunit A
MSDLMDKVKSKQISRRNFLKMTATSAAGLALIGCGNTLTTLSSVGGGKTDLKNGKWIPVPCNQGCGGKCLNQGYVVDGIVIRQKTDDTHPDSPDYPQQRGCIRGRSNRQMYLGADRLKYPLKRKNWQPGGGKKELRGRDEWVRISWDEALDIAASELKRIKEKYGNQAILAPGLSDERGVGMYAGWLPNAYGGCTTTWGQQSQGGFPVVANKMKGDWANGSTECHDRLDIRKSKLIILWGTNNGWSTYGMPAYGYLQAKKAGAKFIMIDPWLSPTAQALVDQWIPIRPGTDGSLLLAIAYHMITNNLQDQAFLDKYTIGFDADHMPEGADTKENFKDYVLGTYDGTPKTPEWASRICGASPDVIRQLAQEAATTKPLAWKSSLAPGRTHNGGNYVQLFYTVGWMTGNVGLPGSEVSAGGAATTGAFGGPNLVQLGPSGLKAPVNPICTNPRGSGALALGNYDPNQYYGLAYAQVWNAILEGKYTDFIHGEKPINIQCIYKIGMGAPLNQNSGASKGYEAYRKVEFVVVSELFMTTDCIFADIVLPSTYYWEKAWGDVINASGNSEAVVLGTQVMPPMFECKDDMWIELELAKRLGIDPAVMQNISMEQACFNKLASATVIKEDGSGFEPLVTITEADIKEYGVKGAPQTGRIPIKELRAKGVYQVKRSPDDNLGFISYAKFRQDPEANPVKTASGKFEIYCKPLAEAMAHFNSVPIDPTPKYRKAVEGYEESFSDWNNQIKGEYPFQLITLHHMRHAHSTFHNIKQINEAFANNLVINPLDAEKLGVKKDETVLISSHYGKVLRRVNITPRIMPGVVILGQGNWTDLDQDGIDRGANTNTLNGPIFVGEGHQPYNTCLVKIEKWTGTPVEPDYLKPQRIMV